MEALILAGVAMSYVGNSAPPQAANTTSPTSGKCTCCLRPSPGSTALGGHRHRARIRNVRVPPGSKHRARFSLAKPGVQPDWEEEIRRVFRQGSGEVLALEQQAGKNDLNAHKLRMEKVIARWDQIQEVLQQAPSAGQVRKLLEEVGGPTQPEQVELSPETVLDSIKYAKEIRARYTVLQLLWDLGLLQTYAKRIVGLE